VLTHISNTERSFHYVNAIPTTDAIRTMETKTPLRNKICITYTYFQYRNAICITTEAVKQFIAATCYIYSLWLLGNQSIIFTARHNASAAVLALQALY